MQSTREMSRLQKKDTYGVFAKPVDEEEVPGYFDIISSPMDFSTIRSTIAAGGYATWAAFAADVKLLTNNAMTFNPPDSIYHKQVFQKPLCTYNLWKKVLHVRMPSYSMSINVFERSKALRVLFFSWKKMERRNFRHFRLRDVIY